ncbi:MAG: hypothetical protein HOV79_30490 [Hamadaea sp.]|nr:hypothetical protein [Hamadaea sp.]
MWERIRAVFTFVVLALFWFFWVELTVNSAGYLLGFGDAHTVEIEDNRTYVDIGRVNGEVEINEVTFADGYWVDAKGRRHSVTLMGENLLPGTKVTSRSRVIPFLVPEFHRRSQAVAGLIIGLLMTGITTYTPFISLRDD